MEFGRIISTHGDSNAALSISGVAVIYAALGQDQNTAPLYGKQGNIEPGNTTADYDIVTIVRLHHAYCSSVELASPEVPGFFCPSLT